MTVSWRGRGGGRGAAHPGAGHSPGVLYLPSAGSGGSPDRRREGAQEAEERSSGCRAGKPPLWAPQPLSVHPEGDSAMAEPPCPVLGLVFCWAEPTRALLSLRGCAACPDPCRERGDSGSPPWRRCWGTTVGSDPAVCGCRGLCLAPARHSIGFYSGNVLWKGDGAGARGEPGCAPAPPDAAAPTAQQSSLSRVCLVPAHSTHRRVSTLEPRELGGQGLPRIRGWSQLLPQQ